MRIATADNIIDHRLAPYEMPIKLAFALFALLLVLAHLPVFSGLLWGLSVILSVTMNLSYPFAAWKTKQFRKVETAIALGLIFLSLAGFFWPPLLIVAIVLHGLWDIAKCRGAGVGFYVWYPPLCALADFLWAAALFFAYRQFSG